MTTSQTLAFTTTSQPTVGTINVNPKQGNIFDTNFEIQLNGFTSSSPPIQYSLWGITSVDPPSRIRLSPGLQQLTDGSKTVTIYLPLILGVQADITDAYGEIVQVQTDIQLS